MASADREGWRQTNASVEEYSYFLNQPISLTFERTPLKWYFDTINFDSRLYNHAWTDALFDIFVPQGQAYCIGAPEWYREPRLLEHQKEAADLSAKELAAQKAVDALFTEAEYGFYATAREACRWNFNDPEQGSGKAQSLVRATVD